MPLKKKEKVVAEVVAEEFMGEIPVARDATQEELESAIEITNTKLHKALDKKFALELDIASMELTMDLLQKELNK